MKKLLALLLTLSVSTAFGTTLSPIQLLNPTGSTSGQAILSTGPAGAPAWGNVSASGLAAQAANTVLANVSASSASPTAAALPSCSTSSSALLYTSASGFSCNTSVNAATLGGTTFAAPGPIGSTTASTGAFTTLSASSTVSGTGFSTYLASPPAIGGTAAAAGSFTTLSATGLITPSTTAGIKGTTAADSANAGSIGEFLPNSNTATALSNGVPANCTSISLTAGDWDVTGVVQYNISGSPSSTNFFTSVSQTSATLDSTLGNLLTFGSSAANTGTQTLRFPAPTVRKNLSTTTTIYLIGDVNFSAGTFTCDGIIRARRVR